MVYPMGIAMRFLFLIALMILIGISCLVPSPLRAELQITGFSEMFGQSQTVVVAKGLEDGPPDGEEMTVKVEISEVIKGNLKPGPYAIALPQYSRFTHRVKKGEEFVAFLDKDKVMRFMANPAAGTKVADGVLCLDGAYAGSAHWVTPGLATVGQLKTFQSKGLLDYQFRGNVFFPQSEKAAWKTSSIVVSGKFDAIKDKAAVSGLPNLDRFPKSQVRIGICHEPSFTVSWSGKRDLKLRGNFAGIDAKTGQMVVHFVVAEPLVLTQKTLEDWLADERRAAPAYRLKLQCVAAKGEDVRKVLTLTMKDSTDRLEGFGEGPLLGFQKSYTYTKGSMSAGQVLAEEIPKTVYGDSILRDGCLRITTKLAAGKFLTINFQIGEPALDDKDTYWTHENRLLYAVDRGGKIEGNLRLHEPTGARILATFAATLDATE